VKEREITIDYNYHDWPGRVTLRIADCPVCEDGKTYIDLSKSERREFCRCCYGRRIVKVK